jgi:hypothetical protein
VSLSALPAITEAWRGQGAIVHYQAHLVRPLDPEEFVSTAASLAGEWVERREGQRERRQWPEEVRVDRRREIRAPQPPEMRALRERLKGGG